MKFRAWNKDAVYEDHLEDETIKSYMTQHEDDEMIDFIIPQILFGHDNGLDEDKITLMQSSGLSDNCGNSIYQNDVIKYGDTIGMVEIIDLQWQVNGTPLVEIEDPTIIGNTFENPELIKRLFAESNR